MDAQVVNQLKELKTIKTIYTFLLHYYISYLVNYFKQILESKSGPKGITIRATLLFLAISPIASLHVSFPVHLTNWISLNYFFLQRENG